MAKFSDLLRIPIENRGTITEQTPAAGKMFIEAAKIRDEFVNHPDLQSELDDAFNNAIQEEIDRQVYEDFLQMLEETPELKLELEKLKELK